MPPDNTDQNAEVIPPVEPNKPEAAPDNMLKVLGYFTDPVEQEKLPNPGAGDDPADKSEEVVTEEVTNDDPAKPEGEPAKETPSAPVIPKDQRAAKVKPSDALDKPPTRQEIADAVRDALETKTPVTPVDPLAKYGELMPHEKRAIELAQFAAKTDPKYKDMEAKEVAFISKYREYVKSVVEAKGEWTAEDAQSEEYQRILKQRPMYQPGDKEDLLIERGVQKGLSKAEQKYSEQLAERDRQIAAIKIGPQMDKVVNAIESDILSVLPTEVATAIKANPKKAITDFGLETPLALTIITDTQHNAREYLALAHKVRVYDKNDPVHTKLVTFITKQGEFLEKIPEDQRQRDGKILISRDRWARTPEDQRARYVTFNDGDVIDMLAVAGRNYLTSAIKAQQELMEKSGYVKKGAAVAPVVTPNASPAKPAGEKPAAPAPVPAKPVSKLAQQNPPKGGATATPGAAAPGKVPIDKQVNAALSALGYGNLPKD